MAESNQSTATTAAESSTPHKLTAEAVGTFVLVFFGCGSATLAGGSIVSIGLTFGLAVVIMGYAVGRISGGHFNPAVSLAAAVTGRLGWRDAGLYAAAQVGGAIVAALLLFILLQGIPGYDTTHSMGQNGFGDLSARGYEWWAAFLLELALTLLFVLVILGMTDSRNERTDLAPLVIGLALAAIHFVAIPATGTSVNPARSIGPALFAGGEPVLQLLVFIPAPLIGAALAAFAYPLLFGSDPAPELTAPAAAADPDGTATQRLAAWGSEPIIQDGWRWDHEAQEWKPLEEWPVDEGSTPTTGQSTGQSTDQPTTRYADESPAPATEQSTDEATGRPSEEDQRP